MPQTVSVNPLTAKQTAIPDDYRTDVDADEFILDFIKNTAGFQDRDIRALIVDGYIEQTMEGAGSVVVTITDPESEILNSGAFDQQVDIVVDNLRFTLSAINKNDDTLDLTFEDFSVARTRKHKEIVTTNRNRLTRAEFVVYLIRRVPSNKHLAIVCPELNKKQPTTSDKKEVKKAKREAGLSNTGDLHVMHADGSVTRANNSQLDLAETILDTGSAMKGMTPKVLASGIAVPMIESGLANLSGGDRDSTGAFQQRRSQGWPASGDVEVDAKAYFEAALEVNKANPGLSIEELSGKVQRPQANLIYRYGKAAKYAKEFVEAYGSAGFTTVAYRKKFVFTTKDENGKARDWWTAIKDTMDVVKWAVFMSNGSLYVISEEDLIKSKPRMKISEEMDGVDRINFSYDIGQPLASATVTCRADRWLAPAGTVVILDGAGPANGRWLVSTLRRPLFSRDTTIELKKSDHSLKEPPSEIVQRATADDAVTHHAGDVNADGGKDGVVHIAQSANRAGVAIQKPVLDFLAKVAGITSEQILINCGTNHNQLVAGTNHESDHWTGYAADLNVDGTATSDENMTERSMNKGGNIALAAMRVCGLSTAEAKRLIPSETQFNHEFSWQGHRVQIGWRTNVGGNHFNHVHIGVER